MAAKQLDISNVIKEAPTKLELLKLLADINDKWYEIGVSLKVSQNVLNSLTSSPVRNTYNLDQVIESWLTTTESHLVTWETVIDAIKSPIVNNIKKATEIHEYLTRKKLSTQAHQTLQKFSDRLSILSLPVEIVQMLYTERVISKETLDEVNGLGGMLGDGPLKALCTTVSEDPNMLAKFAKVLMMSKETIAIAEDMLKEYNPIISLRVTLNRIYQYDFEEMRVAFGELIYNVSPLIESKITSLKDFKKYLKTLYPELRPLLSSARSFDAVMEIVQDKCTIINVCCLKAIANHYKVRGAKQRISKFETKVNGFCKEIKAKICFEQTFTITFCTHLTCNTIVFVLDWEPDEYTLEDIKNLLSKAFKDTADSVQVRTISKGNSIIVTCYAPQHMMDILFMMAEESFDLLKQSGVIKLTFGYFTVFDNKRDMEIRATVEENTKKLISRLELEQTISRKKTMEIESIIRRTKVTEETLPALSAKGQREIETLQDIITSLTLQLGQKDKQIEKLKQSLKDLAFIPKTLKQLTDKGLEDTQAQSSQVEEEFISENTESLLSASKDHLKDLPDDENSVDDEHLDDAKGRTERVEWRDDDNSVYLFSPTSEQCKDVIHKLTYKKQADKKWSIHLWRSSLESFLIIINNLNECAIEKLDVWETPLDSLSVSTLSEVLSNNTILQRLHFDSCPFSGGIKQVSDALSHNPSLIELWLSIATITDEDITHLSEMLSVNKILKELILSYCDITDNGVQYLCNGLAKNQTLNKFDVSYNPQITSKSSSAIAELIMTTRSLGELHLDYTSLNDDDIRMICAALDKNTTIKIVKLSKQHEKACKKLENYQFIKERLSFGDAS